MTFHSPYFFILILGLPFILKNYQGLPLVSLRKRDKNFTAISFSSGVDFSKLPKGKKLTESIAVLNILKSLCLLFLTLALARPQTSTSFSDTLETGRDIMLSLDISGSMRAMDFTIQGKNVERLTALKTVVSEFIEQRVGDRIGLVIFGTDVFTQCPLTTDKNILNQFVSNLEIGMVGEGTALGDGIAIAVKRLKSIKENSKVIILVTDGVKSAGNIDPLQAAEIAKNENIKIYSIGIGGNKPAPFKIVGPFGLTTTQYINVELDEKTLSKIAEATGGKYYNAQDADKLKEIYQEISDIEQRVDKSTNYFVYKEEFLSYLLIGLALLLIHETLKITRYQILP
ncbi:MAG: VWA domain-containing protein [Proteobacteria bacterium]|nr:VWA domain-containing protein [Pseudomonadota bacterium]